MADGGVFSFMSFTRKDFANSVPPLAPISVKKGQVVQVKVILSFS
jgi:hypothetical protein